MTKAAFTCWNNRIAPVFDVARSIQVVVAEAGQIIQQSRIGLSDDIPNIKAWCLVELDIDTLVCGAISSPMQAMISAYGITVISFVAGDLQEVIQAWMDGKLTDIGAYAMPGCRGNAGGRRKKERISRMNGKKGGGRTPGQGRGANAQKGRGRRKGSTGQRQGRTPQSAGSCSRAFSAADNCVCPACGQLAPHERGTPCMQINCPQCGAAMTRQ